MSKKLLAATVCLAAMVLPSCLVRRRQTASPVKRDNRPLLTASKEELIQRIHSVTDPIQSFTIKTDMSPSVGNFLSGEVMDYATISGNILFRRPDEMRILGLDPLLHSTIFDMVSSGNDFRLYVPSKSQFIEGKNDAPGTSKSKLENLRPTAFLTSLLIYPPEPADLTLIEDDTDESKSVYILMVVRQEQSQASADTQRLLRPPFAADRASEDLRCIRRHDQRNEVRELDDVRSHSVSGRCRDPAASRRLRGNVDHPRRQSQLAGPDSR